jgi:hypothetical protein
MIREASSSSIGDEYEGPSQGYCRHLEFLSECIDGRVIVDGLHSIDIGLGDTFIVDCNKED